MTDDPICPHCGELVLPGEADRRLKSMQNFHRECAARGVLGSVGHLLGQCSCYGGTWEDPPLLTKRMAAKMAVALSRVILRGLVPEPPGRD